MVLLLAETNISTPNDSFFRRVAKDMNITLLFEI
jgi:hypothetical protein